MPARRRVFRTSVESEARRAPVVQVSPKIPGRQGRAQFVQHPGLEQESAFLLDLLADIVRDVGIQRVDRVIELHVNLRRQIDGKDAGSLYRSWIPAGLARCPADQSQSLRPAEAATN